MTLPKASEAATGFRAFGVFVRVDQSLRPLLAGRGVKITANLETAGQEPWT